jgi:Holliday junction resolvasome RuvABC DNA-binding subunit
MNANCILFFRQNAYVRYMSYGMSEEFFMENIAVQFRATMYVGRSDSSLPGKACLENDAHLLDHTQVVDRVGGIGSILQVAPERAKAQQSLGFNIAVDIHEKAEVIVKIVLMPSMMSPLALLSSRPTFQQMLQYNAEVRGIANDEGTRNALINSLSTFEKFNYITLWTVGFSGPELLASPNHAAAPRVVDADQVAKPSLLTARPVSPVSNSGTTEAANLEKRVAGLKKMGFNDETIAKMTATIPSQGVSAPRETQHDGAKKTGVHGLKTSRPTPVQSTTASSPVEATTTTSTASATPEWVASRIAALKKVGFNDETIMKVMSTVHAPGVSTGSAAPLALTAQEQVAAHNSGLGSTTSNRAGAPPSPPLDLEERVAGLKKMGFSDATISRVLSTMQSQGVTITSSSARLTSADDSASASGADDDIPAVCKVPGVNAGSLCKPKAKAGS